MEIGCRRARNAPRSSFSEKCMVIYLDQIVILR